MKSQSVKLGTIEHVVRSEDVVMVYIKTEMYGAMVRTYVDFEPCNYEFTVEDEIHFNVYGLLEWRNHYFCHNPLSQKFEEAVVTYDAGRM